MQRFQALQNHQKNFNQQAIDRNQSLPKYLSKNHQCIDNQCLHKKKNQNALNHQTISFQANDQVFQESGALCNQLKNQSDSNFIVASKKKKLNRKTNMSIFIFLGLAIIIYLFFRFDLQVKNRQQTNQASNQISPEVKVTFNYSSLKYEQKSLSVVMLTCCNRQKYLKKSIDSFLKYNTYPINQFILVNDGKVNSQLLEIVQQYDFISFVSTGKKLGQLATIDWVYNLLDTKYVFFTEDDWQTKQDIINQSIDMLQKDPQALQVWNNQAKKTKVAQNKTVLGPSSIVHFVLNPTISRVQEWKKLPMGYAGLTNNVSFGTGAGNAESLISTYYYNQNRYNLRASSTAFVHLAWDIRNKRFVFKKQSK